MNVNIAKIIFTMPNSKDIFDDIAARIHLKETKDEVESMVYLLLHHFVGLSRTDIISRKDVGSFHMPTLNDVIARINREEPIQYILGEADFCGRKFKVNPSVLIPRPETEQIIEEAFHLVADPISAAGTILDIGTGSGCLAITLAKAFPKMDVIATDVSEAALSTARDNAENLKATVEFVRHSITDDDAVWRGVDLIVSNPPYITPSEKDQMDARVLNYEPALALFVPEDDPLRFYQAIAVKAKNILSPSGTIIAEVNQKYGVEVKELFIRHGFGDAVIRKDINGKDRIVISSRR